jgi:hypothetical protein
MLSGRRASDSRGSEADPGVQARNPSRLCVGCRRSHASRGPHPGGGRSIMSRFGFVDGGGDVMGSSNTILRPVDHRRPGVPSDETGSPVQHDHRSGRAGPASCSRYRTGPVQHSCRVEDVECRFQCAGSHGAGLRRAPVVESSSGRAGHSSRRKSATVFPAVTDARSAVSSSRSGALAASTSPASSASMAASTVASSSAAVDALATLLHRR